MEVSEGEWSSSSSSSKLSLSIYKAARNIKKRDNSLYNALRSIYQDSVFVSEISQLWPQLPLLANLRCGLWYSSNFHSTCYFKSTDGHTNNCSFSNSRLNLHVAHLACTYFLLFNNILFFLFYIVYFKDPIFYCFLQLGSAERWLYDC
jgi:tRNA A64-2'-O-ribosylphosphate transferase